MKLKLLSAVSIAWMILSSTSHAQAATIGGTLAPIDPLTGLPIITTVNGSVEPTPIAGTTPIFPTGATVTGANGNTYTRLPAKVSSDRLL